MKNRADWTQGNFIPAIKVFKHLRTLHNVEAVSFHIECLLYSIANQMFYGPPADYIPQLLGAIASKTALEWYLQPLMTPCGERSIFSGDEWTWASWQRYHEAVKSWYSLAWLANREGNEDNAITLWKALLGGGYFPQLVGV
jgi:hypothetical protein